MEPQGLGRASPRVLLVGGSRDNRDMYAFYLRMTGHCVTSVSGGLEALQHIDHNPTPDVLVTDIVLPDLDGLDLCRRIRVQPRFRTMPIITLTALGGEHVPIARAHDAGVDVVLRLPCLPHRLVRAIQTLGSG
jgi:CheY-like chemotaxis protein